MKCIYCKTLYMRKNVFDIYIYIYIYIYIWFNDDGEGVRSYRRINSSVNSRNIIRNIRSISD